MPKKSQKAKPDIQVEDDLAALKAELTGSVSAESEAPASSEAEVAVEPAHEVSADDLLDDVRRSLIEDESDAEKKPSWWNKKAKGKDPEPVEAPSYIVEKPKPEDLYLEQIDELIDLLEPEVEETPKAVVLAEPESLPAAEPEAPVDVAELKKRVFSPSEAGKDQELSEVRAIALEGGEEVFVEVESRPADPVEERLKSFENSLRPYRSFIYYALAFLGVVLAVAAGALLIREYQRNLPPEPTKAISNLPYPTALTLPGGLNFGLGKGTLKDGSWNPRGPEWLEGTEICRWVAIPWSRQLEAVVRTLTQKDTFELKMSNNDKLTYTVYSIKELTLAEMQELDSGSPCLLLVLAKQDSEKRWVVTALP